ETSAKRGCERYDGAGCGGARCDLFLLAVWGWHQPDACRCCRQGSGLSFGSKVRSIRRPVYAVFMGGLERGKRPESGGGQAGGEFERGLDQGRNHVWRQHAALSTAFVSASGG